jgi:hypothetical protein
MTLSSTSLKLFYLGAILCFVMGCKDESAHKTAIAAAVWSKVENYKEQQIKERRSKIIEEANQKADSILLKNAELWQIDSTLRPDLPIRPTKPTFSNENDSIPVKPLFKPSSFKKF